MYDGYLAIGGTDLNVDQIELVNTSRVMTYVRNWNKKVAQGSEPDFMCPIGWIKDCDPCPETGAIFTNGVGYFLPELDPAPWYNPADEASSRFFGLVGVGVEGDEGVTRSAQVQQSIGSGGFVSRNNFLTRELTVKAVAIAADECGMSAGLDWMRTAYTSVLDECLGDYLWFLSCCPSCDTDGPSVGPCWASTYDEFGAGVAPASCPAATFWPATYNEYVTGPPAPSDPVQANEWCDWVDSYNELITGLPEFACGLVECAYPYLRQFRRVRVLEGPTVISNNTMSDGGRMAEIEFVVVAADPDHYTPDLALALAVPHEAGNLLAISDNLMGAAPIDVNPFRADTSPREKLQAARRRAGPEMPTKWNRQTIELGQRTQSSLRNYRPAVSVTGLFNDTENIRIGVWDADGERVAGWFIPKLPAEAEVTIDCAARQTTTLWRDQFRMGRGDVMGWDGGPVVSYPNLDCYSEYTLTVDSAEGQEPDFVVSVQSFETSGKA